MDSSRSSEINRREVLKGTAAASLAAMATSVGSASASVDTTHHQEQRSLIRQENEKSGTTDWQLTRVRINQGKFRTSLIEGYCSAQSLGAGETLRIFVSTEPARDFTLDVYRMGFYGGTGARHLTRLGPLPGKTQPVPQMGPAPGRLRACRWEASLELKIPDEWVSGVYLGKLTTIAASKSEPYWQS